MNTHIFKQAQHLVAENSAALLTGTGVVGVITTALLTGKASIKAYQVLAEEPLRIIESEEPDGPVVYADHTLTDRIKLTAPFFIPPVASGITTISAIVFSYRISASKSAALAAAYGISEKAFSEYKEKVLEHVTPKKAEDIQSSVNKQAIEDNPPPKTFIVADGQVMCLDSFSGQYFKATMEEVRKAENDTNVEIQMGSSGKASLTSYYKRLGIQPLDFAESFAWSTSNPCQVDYTAELTDDQRPCLVLTFVNAPQPMYDDIARQIG